MKIQLILEDLVLNFERQWFVL